jgi:hypothetical protein
MKIFWSVFLASGLAGTVQGQVAPPLPQTSVRAAYLGSLRYPGFTIGLERPHRVVQVIKPKRTFLKERHWVGSLGFYHHATFHSNLFVLLEHQNRRQGSKGWFVETAAGAGFSRTFLSGTTYRVAEGGVVSQKRMAGYQYALLSFAVGGGYNFATVKGKPWRMYAKMSLLTLLPYNNFLYLRPTVQIGVTKALPHFFTSKPSLKIKQK